MSFINKSVKYSQTILLKTELSKLLTKYNYFLANKSQELSNFPFKTSNYHIIPNNGIKYYMYITFKNQLEQCKDNYNIIYLFPDQNINKQIDVPLQQKHFITDYYLEIDKKFNHQCLFSGYLYKSQDTFNFLISDILMYNDNIVDTDYTFRYNLVNELMYPLNLKYLNNHLNIGIHPIFHCDSEHMIKIFMNNFIYKENINTLEHVYNFQTSQIRLTNENDNKETIKQIRKSHYADVYNVYDTQTSNHQGILYVKGLNQSKKLKALFEKDDHVYLNCSYNTTFQKWQPVSF